MPRLPHSVCCSLLGCTWLLSLAPVAAQAQLNLTFGDDDVVTLQNGSAPPLVVKPGQSFGGTLTAKGFQGVMTGPKGTQRVTPKSMPSSTDNPFRDAPAAAKPLKINAGGVSLTLPTATEPMADKPDLPKQKLQMARNLVRMNAPTARSQMEKLMRAHAPDADLLQLMALVLMQADRDREAAACVYDALMMDTCWTWTTLRTSLPDKDTATMMYRRLQRMAQEQPTPERDFLLAWWEHMLDHRPEALAAMQRAAVAHPNDALFLRLMSAWSTDPDAPPAAMP